tara:strand:- start:37 stop:627 length:591 start_codon:yes stop_codon:yes gene_type:complete
MKPILIKNLLTPKEVFWLYNKLTSLPIWALNGLSFYKQEDQNRQYGTIANAVITKDYLPTATSAGLSLYGQSLVYRINERLKEHKLEIPTAIQRFWINSTFKESSSHWPHWDAPDPEAYSMLIFISPVWSDQWLGSFYVDGEEFKFTPGGVVVFKASELHTADNPSLNCPYLRLSANILTARTTEGTINTSTPSNA